MNKNKFRINISIIYTIVLIITSIIFLFIKNYEKMPVLALCFITLLLVYIVINKGPVKVSNSMYFISVIFIFMSQYLGNALNIYFIIPNWDKILHLISGFILAMMGYIVYLNLVKKSTRDKITPWLGPIFAFLFAAACAGVWEIYEYTVDNLFGMLCQNNDLNDTMLDIIAGTGTGLVISILIWISNFKKPIKFIKDIEEEVDC